MKKLLILLNLTIVLASCEPKAPNYIEGDSKKKGIKGIIYFKDTRTGLCFAERGSADAYSFTCVPCDSVQKLIK